MSRDVVATSILTLVLVGFAYPAAAHHPPRFERCQLQTVTGQVERIEWMNPHVEVWIKSDDGGSYDFVWLNLQQLSLAGIQQDSLNVGDHVVVRGTKQQDGARVVMLLSEIHRPADGWQWSQPPQGC